MRKRKLPLLKDVDITGIGAEGKAIARVDDMVLFVPLVMPGDVVDVQVTRKRSRYMEGVVTRIVKPSAQRTNPFCRHFGICGGCRWQHMPYPMQLEHKQKQVSDQLSRIGKLTLPPVSPIIGSEKQTEYRNKLEFTFSDKRWITADEIGDGGEIINRNALGFHLPGRFDRVIDIAHCHLQPEPSNQIRNLVREYALENKLSFYSRGTNTGFLRNLIIRNTLQGEVMVIVVFGYEDKRNREALLDHLLQQVPSIASLQYAVNTKLNDTLFDQEIVVYHGSDHLTETMGNLRFRVGPKSFYQTNSRQVHALYQLVSRWANPAGHETVYDLYTGTGTIALFLAKQAGKVIGIESVPEAVDDAVFNASLNHITNVTFLTGDIKEVLDDSFTGRFGRPDVVVLDPPRAGMHSQVAGRLPQMGAGKIIYVSCNPATQARDLTLLADHYTVTAVQPIDMFPHTQHVENVVMMIRKNR